MAAACAGRIFGTARAHIPLRGIMPRRTPHSARFAAHFVRGIPLRIPSPMTCTVVQATHTGDCIRCQKCAQLPPQECSEAGEPTGAREHVCGPDVILTASVKGAREISAGRSPLAQQVARAVRARQNHVGGVPKNCGSGEQVGRRPLQLWYNISLTRRTGRWR